MKCLVTGAAGFIGSHLSERLIQDGHDVIGIDDLSGGKRSNLESIINHGNFHFFQTDIKDAIINIPAKLISEIDWVFHLAAKADIVPSIEQPELYHDTNVTGTVKILELARRAKAKRFIYAASSSCYGIPDRIPTGELDRIVPMYPYALTKYLGERYVLHWARTYKIKSISLRLFNVYGPRSRTNGTYGAVFGTFLSQLAHGKPLTVVGDGTQQRDFTFVTDVVDAFVRAAESKITNLAINISSNEPQSINYLIELLGSPERVEIPKRPGEPDTTRGSNAVASLLLDWKPKVTFEQGVAVMKDLVNQFKDAPLWTPETIEKATKAWFECLATTDVGALK